MSRTQFITPKFSLTGSLNGQWANKNLDSAEQMSLGGSDSVAAYHSNNVSADSALVAQFEGRYAFSPAFALGAFYDVGRGKLRQNRLPMAKIRQNCTVAVWAYTANTKACLYKVK